MRILPPYEQYRLRAPAPTGTDPAERFWAKVSGGSFEDCWSWTAALSDNGYGRFRDSGRTAYAHRWAYEQLIGPIPERLHLDHLCRNRACVNPWHLEPVTSIVNTRRGHGNASKTHCPAGHPYDAENTRRYRRTGSRQGERICAACRKARRSAKPT